MMGFIQAGSHIDLRKRNQAFQQKAGKINKVKPVEDLEKKPLPKWIVVLLCFVVGGGSQSSFPLPTCLVPRPCVAKLTDFRIRSVVFFELIQQIFNYLTRTK